MEFPLSLGSLYSAKCLCFEILKNAYGHEMFGSQLLDCLP